MKPVIAITCPTDGGGNFLLNRAYVHAILRAGGVPVMLPPIRNAVRTLDFADGVLLVGGGDILPRYYGLDEYDAAQLCAPSPERDEYELELARLCFERDIPTLGICRGVQVMNVALGGTLHFHITGHDKTPVREDPHHGVSIVQDSRLCRLVGDELYVNTCHHQATDSVGKELLVSARAEDGIIEALDAPSRRFFVGVQWHPERMQNHASEVLFAALTAACTAAL